MQLITPPNLHLTDQTVPCLKYKMMLIQIQIFTLKILIRAHLSLLLFSISVCVLRILQQCPFTRKRLDPPQCRQQNSLWSLCLHTPKTRGLLNTPARVEDWAVSPSWVCAVTALWGTRQQPVTLRYTCAETSSVIAPIDRTRRMVVCLARGFPLDRSSGHTFLLINSCVFYWKERNTGWTGRSPCCECPPPPGGLAGLKSRQQSECLWGFSWMSCGETEIVSWLIRKRRPSRGQIQFVHALQQHAGAVSDLTPLSSGRHHMLVANPRWEMCVEMWQL